MNHRLSTTRSARYRGKTLLSIDKNYARRVDTLYRKAFEAPGAISDEATRKRCRLAVMQELDGVCTVFLTHNDSSWPPTREQLKDFQVLYPQDYISVNQANGTVASREAESDISGDDVATSARHPSNLDQNQQAHNRAPVFEKIRDASPLDRSLAPSREVQMGNLLESMLTPSRERAGSTVGLHDSNSVAPSAICDSTSKDMLSTELEAPRRRPVESRRNNTFDGHSLSETAITSVEREAPGRDCIDGVSIDPSVLCTPPNKILPIATTASSGSERSYRTRLSTRRDCSVSPSPRRRRAAVWRTYKAKAGDL